MKTSNKFAMALGVVFLLFPGIGYILNRKSMAYVQPELKTIATRISTDTIRTVVVSGEGATLGLLSVSPLQYGKSEIGLNIQANSINVDGDTLQLILDDKSPVYQGYVHIRHLNTAIFNSDTIKYNKTQ